MTKPNRKSEKMKTKKHQLKNKNHISVPKQPTAASGSSKQKNQTDKDPVYLFLQQKVEAFRNNSGPTNTSLPLVFFFLLLRFFFLPFFLVAERKHDCELRGLAELFASMAADLSDSPSLIVPRMEWYRRNPNLKPLFVCDEFALDDGAGARAPFTNFPVEWFSFYFLVYLCIWRAPYAILWLPP